MLPVIWDFFCNNALKILLIIDPGFGSRGPPRRAASMLSGQGQGYQVGLGVSNNICLMETASYMDTLRSLARHSKMHYLFHLPVPTWSVIHWSTPQLVTTSHLIM